ncbi:DMT family transporter [uncultured Paracoccus sp.]|uniref:DMT family transporter n=1 Tax=uncultured Paracoccus sp. TaxID=189685 RepID=UPI002615BB56|nr:DMT family transporter [uncultured Paracoccus sp.]
MHTPAPLAVLGLVALATTAIVCGDTAGKLLTEAGVRPLFVAWSRFALAALLLAWSLGLRRSNLRDLLDWRLILRAAFIVGGIGSIMTALSTERIANVFGAFFIGPVVAYALSALLLRERVSWARTAMLALGFAGVLLVVGRSQGHVLSPCICPSTAAHSAAHAARWPRGSAGKRPSATARPKKPRRGRPSARLTTSAAIMGRPATTSSRMVCSSAAAAWESRHRWCTRSACSTAAGRSRSTRWSVTGCRAGGAQFLRRDRPSAHLRGAQD